jgi:hypothetical protein
MRQADTSGLSCSFCRKSQDSVAKLISNAGGGPRAYICDECIAVCVTILDDERDRPPHVSGTPVSHPLLAHPHTPSLLAAVERWIRRESLGGDAAQELADVRSVAIKIMGG